MPSDCRQPTPPLSSLCLNNFPPSLPPISTALIIISSRFVQCVTFFITLGMFAANLCSYDYVSAFFKTSRLPHQDQLPFRVATRWRSFGNDITARFNAHVGENDIIALSIEQDSMRMWVETISRQDSMRMWVSVGSLLRGFISRACIAWKRGPITPPNEEEEEEKVHKDINKRINIVYNNQKVPFGTLRVASKGFRIKIPGPVLQGQTFLVYSMKWVGKTSIIRTLGITILPPLLAEIVLARSWKWAHGQE